jgi:threonine dehydratase
VTEPAPLLDDLRAAAAALAAVAPRTPLLDAPDLTERIGAPVMLKLEQLHPIGAFKVRGAFTAVSRLSDEARRRGVVTHSSGNHGQAVAWAARHFGVAAVVVMPADASAVKVEGVRRHGGEVVFVEHRHERAPRAEALARERGLTLVPPYEHADVILGQGTCGLEILDQCPEVGTILVPVGGGGLIAGIASAVRRVKPAVRVIGVEPAGAPKLSRALAAGHPVSLERTGSIADGLLPNRIGTLPFEVMQPTVREAVTVDDDAIGAAVRYIFDRLRLTVEPSGAVTTAALLAGRVPAPHRGGPVVAVVSGGNVEPALFERLVHASPS